jgi:hypothetical protein
MPERPPPNSIQGLRARRANGRKAPKKYRKYHDSEKNKKKQDTSGMEPFTKGVMWVARGLGKAFEALR